MKKILMLTLLVTSSLTMAQKTKIESGDFKFLAAFGAWMGPLAIIPILLLSCTAGALIGITLRLKGSLEQNQSIAFGPYLAVAALIMFFGSNIIYTFLHFQ